MKKIFIIKNEDDFRSLMVDLEKESAEREPTDVLIWSSFSSVKLSLSLKERERENLDYSFKEILEMEWNASWGVEFYHPDIGKRYVGLLDDLMFDLSDYQPSNVHKILSEAKFYINKEH